VQQEVQEKKDAGIEDKFECTPCGEGEKMRAVRAPHRPTPREVEDHELTHCPYRAWCDHCVRGQAKDRPHVTLKGDLAESTVARVIMDYCFMTEDVKGEITEHV
jgi:hypothetical protein